MPTICQCGQDLDLLEFDEECPGCLAERAYEEREQRDRELKEEAIMDHIDPDRLNN